MCISIAGMVTVEEEEAADTIEVQLMVVEKLQLCLFLLFFLMYLSTITGNTIIITVIWQCHKLHSPLYLFLGNFAFMEICYSSVTMPKMLADLSSGNKQISIHGCLTQLYFFFVLGAIENYFLALMAFDRYVAICIPLRYTAIMSNKFCHQLALMTWLVSFAGSLLPIHLLIWIIVFSCLFFIILSYFQIILVVLKIPSNTGRKKVFSTCGSHFTVVILYYGSVISMYVRPNHGYTFVFDKCLSVFYAVVTPFLNPIIYSLRNKNIRKAIQLFKCNSFKDQT
ncbi:olfactory receptor 6N1-like [Ranitomeya variabilis]|uniref:olfactory receptor 6N1-like n=1 Tax=Ranitomeya variabilis TaxID=490064 RepID=UPI0040564065